MQDPSVVDQSKAWDQNSTVQHAVGVLILAMRVSPSDAMATIERAAVRHQTQLERLAEAIVCTASTGEMPQRGLQEILTLEWGDLLL